jgi:ligand-binding sensor domain-containing protein
MVRNWQVRRSPTACRRLMVGLTVQLFWAAPAAATWQTYTPSDGLAGTDIAEITQDSAGSLWFATTTGLSRYDGVDWRTYTSSNSGMFFDGAQCVLADRQGAVWVGHYARGLSRLRNGVWGHFDTEDGIRGSDVVTLCEDSQGRIWCGTTDGGASYFDGERWNPFTELPGQHVFRIVADRGGDIWFGTNAGLSRLHGTALISFTTSDNLTRNDVHAICQDSQGRIWIGYGELGGGASVYDGSLWRTVTKADGLVANDVRAIAADKSGEVWFATWSGICRLRHGKWEEFASFAAADGLVDNWVTCIFRDRVGNLWIGTLLAGVSRFDGGAWRPAPPGVPSPWVNTVLQDRGGRIWAGTWGSGVGCYDGSEWSYARSPLLLGSNFIWCACEDSRGRIWFGTLRGGASCYDPAVGWKTYWPEPGGLADSTVWSITEDTRHRLWFGTAGKGISILDGERWTTVTFAGDAETNSVTSGFCDSRGNLWFTTPVRGIHRFDVSGSPPERLHIPGGDQEDVAAIGEDAQGGIWFGTGRGVAVLDRGQWRSGPEGLGNVAVRSMIRDSLGRMVLATNTGLARFDGERWALVTRDEGLATNSLLSVIEDRCGGVWIASDAAGLMQYQWENVPPLALVHPAPPRVSANRVQSAGFTVGYEDDRDIEYRFALDDGTWSDWSKASTWLAQGLSDAAHVLHLRARDRFGNDDSVGTAITFEVDGTPPQPIISDPVNGGIIRSSAVISGTASDLRFKSYALHVRRKGTTGWEAIGASPDPVTSGMLGIWDTRGLPDGDYELQLSVADTLGLTGVYPVSVVVDNAPPRVYETSGAKVVAGTGGNIYSESGAAHLYLPPHALGEDANVQVDTLREVDLPSRPAGVGAYVSGYVIEWSNVGLSKAATLEVSVPAGGLGPTGQAAIYVLSAGSAWARVGGTVAGAGISTPIRQPGRYGIFLETDAPSGAATLDDLSVTPRVFSPQGTYASDDVALSFSIGRSGPVTVQVYNRAGRLIRSVVSGETMNAGANLVRWNGRDVDGHAVEDGLYLVAVEAFGKRQTKTLAVVR